MLISVPTQLGNYCHLSHYPLWAPSRLCVRPVSLLSSRERLPKLFIKFHDQFYDIQGIRSEALEEGTVADDFVFGNSQLFSDDLDDAMPNGRKLARIEEASLG